MRGTLLLACAALACAQDARITGRVLDEAGAPAAGFRLQIQSTGGFPPHQVTATTDAEGLFAAEVQPGEYYAQVTHHNKQAAAPLTTFTDEDFDKIDQLVETSYWPGGVDEPSRVLPLVASPGGSADVGTIRLRTAPHYRVKFSMDDCSGNVSLQVIRESIWLSGTDERDRFFSMDSRPNFGRIPCDKEVLITALAAGKYWFAVTQSGATPRWALEQVTITRGNVALRTRMQPTTEITGQITPVDGTADVQVALTPTIPGLLATNQPARVDAEGRFRFERLFWPSHRVDVTLRPGFFVTEVRFDGRAAAGRAITVTPGVPGQLQIAIEHQGATLTGRVSGDGELTVVLVRDDMSDALDVPVTGGQFRIEGILPGDYHAMVVTKERMEAFFESKVVRQILDSGVAITLRKGETRDVTLSVTR